MSEKSPIPPSLRVENGNYHEQAAEVMRSLIRFYDLMIKLGPFMKISQTKLDKLEGRAKLARDNLRKFIQLVPAKNDKEEKLDFPSTYGPQPVTQMMDKIVTDCSLPVDMQHLRKEMVELKVLEPYSTITRESCRLFFDSLSDKSAVLRLENYNKIVTKKRSTTVKTEKKECHVTEPFDNSYMYIYPPGFTPSAATKAFLEEQAPSPKKTYALPPDIFDNRRKVLPDIHGDLQKEMERLAAQTSTSHGKPEKEESKLHIASAPAKKGTSRIIIDRYDEFLKIKKTMQGLIGPADSTMAKTALGDTIYKQKIEDSSQQASESSDFVMLTAAAVSGTSSKSDSKVHAVIDPFNAKDYPLPGVKDKKHYAKERHRSKSSGKIRSNVEKRKRKEIEASQDKTSGHFQTRNGEKVGSKTSDRSVKQRNKKRISDKVGDGKYTDNEEPASKRMKASPVQLSFLEPAYIQDFKIPKRGVKRVKCLEIPKVNLKRKRHGDVERDRCGKRSRNH